jgi:nucleoside-diphosphate-sugar epimerase
MRILVTGATGFVGRHLLASSSGDHELVALARGAPPDELRAHADWIEADLSWPLETARLPERVDAVVHLAQSPRYRDFPDGASDVFAVNAAATVGLLEYAHAARASRFVLASSGAVYRPSPDPLTEDAPPDPSGLYASSKAAAEWSVRSYAELMDTVVLRFFFVYGAGQTGMLIPSLAQRVLEGQPVEVRGDPGLRLNPIHVDDAVRVFAPALGLAGGGIFNVAGPDVVSLTELVELIGEVAGVAPAIAHVAGEQGDLVADIRRMVETLGIEPMVPLREGIGRVVAGRSP